jgi:transposase
MNDAEDTQGMARSTEEIASAGGGGEGPASPAKHQDPLADSQAERSAQALRGSPNSDLGTDGQPHAQLLEDHELQSILAQWKDIQAEFVDEPKIAVQNADALVAELMQRLAQVFASERQQLESRWSGGADVSTEDLRRGLRRYRSFFERLLAA